MSQSSYTKQWSYRGSIIRQRGMSYQVETNHNGRRRRVTKKTRAEAETYATEMRDQVKAEGSTALALSGRERLDAVEALRMFPTSEIRQAANHALEILPYPANRADTSEALAILRGDVDLGEMEKPRHSPLAEAARFWLRHHPEGATPPSVKEVLEKYLDAKRHRRPETIREIRNKAGRFCNDFGDRTIADVTTQDIDSWLTENTPTPGNKKKYLRILHAFFDFAQRKWNMESNPTDKVFVDKHDLDEVLPEAYSVGEVARMLRAAAAHEKADRIVPTLVIGLLGGLRPSEIQASDWKDISFAEKHIRVRPETAKRRRQRYVEMSDNLCAWLAPYRRTAGPVAPPSITFRRLRAEILEEAGIGKWLRDGLRHTFASYHLAMYEDEAKTAFELGHRGNASVVYEHYRKLVKKTDAQKFWDLYPGERGIIRLPTAS